MKVEQRNIPVVVKKVLQLLSEQHLYSSQIIVIRQFIDEQYQYVIRLLVDREALTEKFDGRL